MPLSMVKCGFEMIPLHISYTKIERGYLIGVGVVKA